MRKSLPAVFLCLVVASVVFPLAGCIAHAPGSGGGGGSQISVTVASSLAAPVNVTLSTTTAPTTVQYTATVTGTSNQAVTWTLAADTTATTVCTASGAALGTMTFPTDNTMTYTAPPQTTILPVSPCDVVVTATANEDNTTIGQARLALHVIVTVSPATDSIGQQGNRQFTAAVLGTANQTVVWSEACPTCPGNQSGGKFDVNASNLGLYYAPQLNPGTSSIADTVTATAVFDQTATATATMTVTPTDSLGTIAQATASDAAIQCPVFGDGVIGASCYQLTVSCNGVDDTTAYLKVNTPSGTPNAGTIIFGTANGMTTLYDDDPIFMGASGNGGDTVVQGVLNSFTRDSVTYAGFTTVQVSFGGPFDTTASANGWLQGPGGVRRLACRYATVADWVYTNIHSSDTTSPMCATGHREGASALAYAASEYGLASKFSLIENTSGPSMTRIHLGCNVCGGQFVGSNPCTQTSGINMCYAGTDNKLDTTAATIDAAYQAPGQTTPTLCTDAINATNPANYSRFQSDSIEDDPGVSPAFPIPNGPTNVNVLLGYLDTGSAAVAQAYTWWGAVGPQPPLNWPPQSTCPADWPQSIPSVADGSARIVSDIQTMCVVH